MHRFSIVPSPVRRSVCWSIPVGLTLLWAAIATPARAVSPGESSAGSAAKAAAPTVGPVESSALTLGSQISFRSEVLGREVSMRLWVPESLELSSDEHTYPIVFANGGHGAQFFHTLVGLVKHLGDRERIPESIVVSLDDAAMIPTVHTHGMWGAEKIGGDPDPERALRHLEREVIPFLEREYRANHYRMIVGVSGSTLFPIYALSEATDLFDAYVLIAAADMVGMGFDAETTFVDAWDELFRTTEDGETAGGPTSRPARRPTKLYVGVADDDVAKREDYAANMETLQERLGGRDALDLRVEVVPNTDHYEVFIPSMLAALDQSFPKELWSSRYRDLVAEPGDALENIDRYYAALSEEYGFTVLPRADRWNNVNCLRFMIRHLGRLGRTQEAVAVAERRLQYRPRSAASYDGLADALEADGQLERAAAAQQKAVELESDESRRERLAALQEAVESAAALP